MTQLGIGRPPVRWGGILSPYRGFKNAATMNPAISTKRAYAICANCIMDTSDSGITFDSRGWCDYCTNYYENILPNWHPDERGLEEIRKEADAIKRDGKGKDHDCLIGISGGVDSSYLAYVAKEILGLRPLLYHVDAGWNSQQAVNNIERMVDGLNLDLHTEVVDWHEMQDLQLAFFKAQVPHVDTPQDLAFFGGLFNFAAKYGYKYILTGANHSTECVKEPIEWHYHASDLRQVKDIHRQFGRRELKTFPLTDIFTYKLYYRFVKGIRIVRPLNNVPFEKERAMQELVDKYGWQKYAHKHYESRFTRFYEGYWLPVKFGYDKRRAHFSSLILTKQMTRDEALVKIAQRAYDEETLAQDFEYIATKLDLSVSEFRAIMNGPNKSFRDYKNAMWLIDLGARALRAMGVEKRIVR
jgi:N-acetyl sugar amidotransferase